MKIRTDFVTNSSSSSFITIEITNQELKKRLGLMGYGDIKGLDKFDIDFESDDEFLEDYRTEQFMDFHKNYLKVRKGIANCLQTYFKDKHNVELTRNDFIQSETTYGYGEGLHGYVDSYGVAFEEYSFTNLIMSEYIMDNDVEYDYGESLGIEFQGEGEVVSDVLQDEKKIKNCIDNFISAYGKECLGYSQVITAYIKALDRKGMDNNSIVALMANYTNRNEIEKVLSGEIKIVNEEDHKNRYAAYTGHSMKEGVYGQVDSIEEGIGYSGGMKDGKKHGQGKNVSKVGNTYVGNYEKGMRHGQGAFTRFDGREYVGEWKNDLYHGKGTLTTENGDKYVGEWEEGQKHGKGTETRADGSVIKGFWKKGEYVGE